MEHDGRQTRRQLRQHPAMLQRGTIPHGTGIAIDDKHGEVMVQQPFQPDFPSFSDNIPILIGTTFNELQRQRYNQPITLEEARGRVKELLVAEEDILFEKQSKTYEDGTMDVIYEYVIFKDVRDDEPQPTYLKNEYGKYVEHNVQYNGKNYEIIEKCKAKVEDDVWVYGYDPRNDRKTFAWVFNNVLNEGFSSAYDMKRIYLYHNKIVFCNDANEIDIVICKNASDAVRFYNVLQKHCKKGPYLFMGAVTTKSALCESLEKLLLEKTGWDIGKLRRNQHRF